MKTLRVVWLFGGLIAATAAAFPVTASTSANPGLAFYGYNQIVADPPYPVVGEPANISVTITNSGDAPANNVAVKLSFNDWGVTFSGWQEIGTVTLASIPAGGTATASYTHTFQSRAHTCLEALIVSADENSDPNDDRGQINLEVVNAGESFTYPVPVVNNGDQPANLHIQGRCAGRPDGQHHHRCREIAEDVVLGPGEQIEVPVKIDFAGAPVGEVVVFNVDAFDPADPADPHTRNHVRLVVARQTARGLIQQARADLLAAAAQEGQRPAREQLQASAHQLGNVLAPRFWLDADHVAENGGQRVFAEAAAVEHKLLALQPGRARPVGDLLNRAVRSVGDAARILAQEGRRSRRAGGRRAATRGRVCAGSPELRDGLAGRVTLPGCRGGGFQLGGLPSLEPGSL